MHNETFYTKKNINNIKLAVFSDIHYYPEFKQKTFDRIIKQIKNNQPNYIVIVGDLLDDSKYESFERFLNFLNNLSSFAPIIMTIGNHDKKSGQMWTWEYKKNQSFINELKKINNLHLLQDEIWTDNNISFYGFDLSFEHYENKYESYNSFCQEIKMLKSKFPNNTYNITLSHSPTNIYDYIENNPQDNLNKSDLILSGHMHNGCLPFWISNIINKTFKTNRSIIAPKKTFFPKYAQGRVYKPKDGYIFEGITKFSKSTKYFHYLDFIYQKNVEFITIKKNDD